MGMKQLTKDSYIFNLLDGTSNMKQKMAGYNPHIDNLDLNAIEDDMRLIQRRYNFPTKNRVMNDVETGRIVPILNKDHVMIPASIPAYLRLDPMRNRVVAICNFNPYMSKSADGQVYGDPRQMFCLLQTGSMLLGVRENWNNIVANNEVCKLGAGMYAKLFGKVLDKLYAINLDEYKADKVRFMAAKFFLVNMMGKPMSEGVLAQASTVCKVMTNNSVSQFNDSLPEHAFDDIKQLCDAISIHIDGCSSLNVRTFISQWLMMYGKASALAIDYLPFFFHMIFSVSLGAHMVTEMVVDSLLGKDIDKLYNAVANIIR